MRKGQAGDEEGAGAETGLRKGQRTCREVAEDGAEGAQGALRQDVGSIVEEVAEIVSRRRQR